MSSTRGLCCLTLDCADLPGCREDSTTDARCPTITTESWELETETELSPGPRESEYRWSMCCSLLDPSQRVGRDPRLLHRSVRRRSRLDGSYPLRFRHA